jgi:hypothetical protein
MVGHSSVVCSLGYEDHITILKEILPSGIWENEIGPDKRIDRAIFSEVSRKEI